MRTEERPSQSPQLYQPTQKKIVLLLNKDLEKFVF